MRGIAPVARSAAESRMLNRRFRVVVLAAAVAAGSAAMKDPIDRIREADLKRDLFALAGDAMRGREGGTLDEMTASAWVAERAREAGLQPAGDNGTYFQFFPLERLRVSAASTVTLDGRPLRMGHDVVPDNAVIARVDAPVTVASGDSLEGLAIKDRALVVRYAPSQPPTGNALRTWLRGVQRAAQASAPAAIIAVVPDAASDQWDRVAVSLPRGTYGLDPDGTAEPRLPPAGVPLLYVRESALAGPIRDEARLAASITVDSFTYPSVNVIAKVPGRDARLAGEYVLFSAHQDHDGQRYTVNGDNIWNGADDNATTAVALLAIGRAMSAQPGRRSALFVWHGSEERGLMGSRWFVKHPAVPLTSIVAVLNGDMIGRNNPDSAALLGSQPPHRNSSDLVAMALKANGLTGKFTLDTIWDRPTHPEGWYFRSDHLPYARMNVPALMYSTNLHDDYHTPRDNPAHIDYPKLTRMAQWIYLTGWFVANAPERPKLDPGFRLER